MVSAQGSPRSGTGAGNTTFLLPGRVISASRHERRAAAGLLDRHGPAERAGSSRAFTVMFETHGCSWRRCLGMSGPRHERHGRVEDAEALVRAQVTYIRREYDGREFDLVKVFDSGSLLDPGEVPPAALDAIGDAFRGRTPDPRDPARVCRLRPARRPAAHLDDGTVARPVYVAIGLETTNNLVREKSIDKGFSYHGVLPRGPRGKNGRRRCQGLPAAQAPLPDRDRGNQRHGAVNHRRIGPCGPGLDEPLHGPATDRVRVVLAAAGLSTAVPLVGPEDTARCRTARHSDPLGGGRHRGPHNCGECDREIVDAIRDYSLTADRSRLVEAMAIPCDCKKEWEFVIGNERPYFMPLTR